MREIKHLKKSPIMQAVIEICYEPNKPVSAIYGLLLDVFEKGKTEELLPFLPVELKNANPILKQQEIYRCIYENKRTIYVFGIGSNVIRFYVLGEYKSWLDWKNQRDGILESIRKANIIKSCESISLRYCDIFDFDALNEINAEFSLKGEKIKDKPITFSVETTEDGMTIKTNISNEVFINGMRKLGSSAIDIFCARKLTTHDDFFAYYNDILEREHRTNKKQFFSLLKPSLLEKLEPEYDEYNEVKNIEIQ